MDTEAENALLRTKIKLMTKAPFISHIALKLKTSFGTCVPTAGTDGTQIIFNPEFFMNLSPAVRLGLFAHEVYHVLFKHMFRMADREKLKWNYAADYAINLILDDCGYELPTGALLNSAFKTMSTEAIYAALPTSNLHCSYGASDLSNDILDPPKDQDSSAIEIDIDQIIREAAELSTPTAKELGGADSKLARELSDTLQPRLDPYHILQNLLTDFDKTDYTMRRANRRYMPDFYLPTLHSPAIKNLTFAIDISGSVTTEETEKHMVEIDFINKTFQPETLTIISFSTKIHDVFELQLGDDVMDVKINGTGGTAVQPVFRHCNKNPPTVLIFFTDGWFEDCPKEVAYPVIWILVDSMGCDIPPIGECIYLD